MDMASVPAFVSQKLWTATGGSYYRCTAGHKAISVAAQYIE
jgi:hypothetical protein